MSLRERMNKFFGKPTVDIVVVGWRYLFSFSDVSKDGGKGSTLTMEDALLEKQALIKQFREMLAELEGSEKSLIDDISELKSTISRNESIVTSGRYTEDQEQLAASEIVVAENALNTLTPQLQNIQQNIANAKRSLRAEEMELQEMNMQKQYSKYTVKVADLQKKNAHLASRIHQIGGENERFNDAKNAIIERGYKEAANLQLTTDSVQSSARELKTSTSSSAAKAKIEELKQRKQLQQG